MELLLGRIISGISTMTKATAGSTGNTSFTGAISDDGFVGQFAFRPAGEANDQIRVDVSWDGGTTWSSTQNSP